MTTIPIEHIKDSHLLVADGRVELYQLTPAGGSGVLRFKPDNTVTWRDDVYTGVPIQASGEKKNADNGNVFPQLVIGSENSDLSMFKPLIYDGTLDGAIIVKMTVLLDNLINNRLIRESQTMRVKRVVEYSRSHVSLQLATNSDALGFEMPYRQYLPPAFPSVQM